MSGRLKKAQVRGKRITLKVLVRKPDAPVETVKFGGYGVCDAISRSKAIDSYTDDCDLINTEVVRLRKLMQVLLFISHLRVFAASLSWNCKYTQIYLITLYWPTSSSLVWNPLHSKLKCSELSSWLLKYRKYCFSFPLLNLKL